MEATLKDQFKKLYDESVEELTELETAMKTAKKAHIEAKEAFEKQKRLVDQNAKALKVYDEPKKRVRKPKNPPVVAAAQREDTDPQVIGK